MQVKRGLFSFEQQVKAMWTRFLKSMSALKSVSGVTVYCLSDANQMYQFKNRLFFPKLFF